MHSCMHNKYECIYHYLWLMSHQAKPVVNTYCFSIAYSLINTLIHFVQSTTYGDLSQLATTLGLTDVAGILK